MRPTDPPQQSEFETSWLRLGGRRKRRRFVHLQSAQRLANALVNASRPGLAPVVEVMIRQRVVGEWQILSRREGGAK